jgi:magnesium-transporting ATPase (P-type)
MLAFGQLAFLVSCRFLGRSSITLDVLRGNRIVWWSAAALVALQAAFVYTPALQRLFDVASVGPDEWSLFLGCQWSSSSSRRPPRRSVAG